MPTSAKLEENKDRIEYKQQRKQYSDEMFNIRDREEALQAHGQELQSNQCEREQQLKIEQGKTLAVARSAGPSG
jgi:hypothetical protein